MSLVADKNDIVNQLKVFSSLKENLPKLKNNNSLPSINSSKKEILPFLLDMLSTLVGSSALQKMIGEILSKFLNTVEPTLKNVVLSETVLPNSSNILPTWFTNGLSIPTSTIDPQGKYKTNPSSSQGAYIYNGGFDNIMHQVISNPNSTASYGGMNISYNQGANTFRFQGANPSMTIQGFLTSYVNNLILINKKVFIAEVLDAIFGSLSFNLNKSVKSIMDDEKDNTVLTKIIAEEDESKIYSFSSDELLEIEKIAKEKSLGIRVLDFSCGTIETSLPLSGLTGSVDETFNSTDPNAIGNSIGNTLNESFNDNSINKDVAKDGFLKELIKKIEMLIIKALFLTPQMRILFLLIQGFKNNGIINLNDDSITSLQKNKNTVSCISKNAKAELIKFVFEILKKEILKIITPALKQIAEEKIKGYLGTLTSLVFKK